MKIPADHLRLAQQILKDLGYYHHGIDGHFGGYSIAAALQFTGGVPVRGVMTGERFAALTIQHHAHLTGTAPNIVRDGWYGADTKDAAHRLLGETFARPDEKAATGTPAAVRCWSPTDAQMTAKYGEVGTHQITVTLPFPMRLDWDTDTVVHRQTCHRLFAKPYTEALEMILAAYGLEGIRELNIDRTGGILNVRKKRGGTTWSTHAWGVAVDLWPSANLLAWKKDRAAFAKPAYKLMRDAFRKVGLMSLGECYDFDWMHWQLNPGE